MAVCAARLSDFYGAPADELLGALPPPKPIPEITDMERRVLTDVIDWSPTVADEIQQSLHAKQQNVNYAIRCLVDKGMIQRVRKPGNHQPYIITPTEEGRSAARALEMREVV